MLGALLWKALLGLREATLWGTTCSPMQALWLPCSGVLWLLQGRTADLRFGRSRVHAWGLFAKRAIEPETFIIEYVGQVRLRGPSATVRPTQQELERHPWHMCSNMQRSWREQSCHVHFCTALYKKYSSLLHLRLSAVMCVAPLLAWYT